MNLPTGACASGQHVDAINADLSVHCTADSGGSSGGGAQVIGVSSYALSVGQNATHYGPPFGAMNLAYDNMESLYQLSFPKAGAISKLCLTTGEIMRNLPMVRWYSLSVLMDLTVLW